MVFRFLEMMTDQPLSSVNKLQVRTGATIHRQRDAAGGAPEIRRLMTLFSRSNQNGAPIKMANELTRIPRNLRGPPSQQTTPPQTLLLP